MFKEQFIKLCNEKGVAPTVVCQSIGLSNAVFSKWGDESIPRRATLQKLADYFGVSVDYLLGNTDEKKKPTADGGEPLQTDDPLLKDAIAIMEKLSPEKQEQAFQFLQFLSKDSQHNH